MYDDGIFVYVIIFECYVYFDVFYSDLDLIVIEDDYVDIFFDIFVD